MVNIRQITTTTTLIALILAIFAQCQRTGKSYEEECEREEEMVEVCAADFLIFRNDSLPQTEPEMDAFCRTFKEKERCLRDHSNKCLSHSANQAIMELIRTISSKNQAICSNKQRRNLYLRANQCLNRQRSISDQQCYGTFVDRIHGIHQFSQVDKIPIICCNYHDFLTCEQNQMKLCSNDLSNSIARLLQSYSGETLNYVCKEFKNNPAKCQKASTDIVQDLKSINETRPKTFFSLLVKIYLS